GQVGVAGVCPADWPALALEVDDDSIDEIPDLFRHRNGDEESPWGLNGFFGWSLFGEALAALLRGAPFGGGIVLVHTRSIRERETRAYGGEGAKAGIARMRPDAEFRVVGYRLRMRMS